MLYSNLVEMLNQFVETNNENAVDASYALHPDYVGVCYYDEPLTACAAADDPLFTQFQTDPMIYGSAFRKPEEWLPGATRVLSVFFPYSKSIRDSNRGNSSKPSELWLHARIEGHSFLQKACRQVAAWLQKQGFQAVIPSDSPSFRVNYTPERTAMGSPGYVSSWSERHIAYAAGLGTFGLSKHIITEKGVCGRLGSIVTNAPLPVTPRPYSDPFAYCILCGKCSRACPASAISPRKGMVLGKDILACGAYIEETKIRFAPRYGCGKCQLDVPCETEIPRRPQMKP